MVCLHSFIGNRKRGKRVGRGIGSGMGKTSCRGHKGQKARSSNIGGFEGGQLPIIRSLPKRGFRVSRRYKVNYSLINLAVLQRLVDEGRIKTVVDVNILRFCGVVRSNAVALKVLGEGTIRSPLIFKSTVFSAKALAAVEAAGGSSQ